MTTITDTEEAILLNQTEQGDRRETWLRRVLYSKEIGLLVLLALLLVGLYFFAFRQMRFFMVPSASMAPTLLPEDMIVTIKEDRYERGDIVVWRKDGEYLVKRIVGLPGDSVGVVDGALFINGKYASEPYLHEPMRYIVERPVRIPEGRFFYLGDNRNESEDSSVGFTLTEAPLFNADPQAWLGELEAIVGKAIFIYYPYSRFGPIRSYPLINVAGQ